jgi:hypothetical protein
MVHWCRIARPGEPPRFYPISNGKTAEEAINRALFGVPLTMNWVQEVVCLNPVVPIELTQCQIAGSVVWHFLNQVSTR